MLTSTDWLLCLLSIAIAAVCNPVKVVRQIWPHITILGLFAGFVAWNGGVVLGKSCLPSLFLFTLANTNPIT